MLRGLIAVAAILFPVFVLAQSHYPVCNDAKVVFVGRARPAVTFHVSGEPAIERARQHLKRVEEEVARERATLDDRTRLERSAEFELRVIRAQTELDAHRAMYPPPIDLTFYPVIVEQALRGVTESEVMLLDRDNHPPLVADETYLIVGHRRDGLVPPLPDMADLAHLNNAVEVVSAKRAASVPREVEFFAATQAGATVLGTLRIHSYSEAPGSRLRGVRILVTSGDNTIETTTSDDGSFVVSGIPAGRIEIKPVLPSDLAIVNRSALIADVRDGVCHGVGLTADINGRVRGRILSTSGRSMKGATLHLSSIDLTEFLQDPSIFRGSSHTPHLQVAAREDGTFEFFGVPPGTYLLFAWVPKVVDGKERTLTTFYPGSTEQSAARPVTVGRATEHDGFEFVVQD